MFERLFFISILFSLIFATPSAADMMDDVNTIQSMSSLLMEGKLEEAAELFSKVEEPDMKEIAAISLLGQFIQGGEVVRAESLLEFILNEDVRQATYTSFITAFTLIKKDCVKAKKYIDLLSDQKTQQLVQTSYEMICE